MGIEPALDDSDVRFLLQELNSFIRTQAVHDYNFSRPPNFAKRALNICVLVERQNDWCNVVQEGHIQGLLLNTVRQLTGALEVLTRDRERIEHASGKLSVPPIRQRWIEKGVIVGMQECRDALGQCGPHFYIDSWAHFSQDS